MRYEEREHSFTCPYCWQPVTVVLDTSVRRQTYIEDCEVCCNPIEIHYEIDSYSAVTHFHARKAR